jgi:hypothetical protein
MLELGLESQDSWDLDSGVGCIDRWRMKDQGMEQTHRIKDIRESLDDFRQKL